MAALFEIGGLKELRRDLGIVVARKNSASTEDVLSITESSSAKGFHAAGFKGGESIDTQNQEQATTTNRRRPFVERKDSNCCCSLTRATKIQTARSISTDDTILTESGFHEKVGRTIPYVYVYTRWREKLEPLFVWTPALGNNRQEQLSCVISCRCCHHG